jgi:16S rRNA (cytidine1402-2'-O)-methyltransferase
MSVNKPQTDAQGPGAADPDATRDPLWQPRPGRPQPGLYLVATPIGAARDVTLRALDLFAQADVLAAEDTRSLRHLLDIHGVRLEGRQILSYHDHNGPQARPAILRALGEGKSVAYASEAGTPMVADPGYQLVRAAVDAGHQVFAAPGASAVLAALAVSGLPSDRFCFMGFAPAQGAARKAFLQEAAAIPATLVFYESPKRVHRLIDELRAIAGGDRAATLCRELTKRFEEVLRGSLDDLAAALVDRSLKGEIVLLVDRARGAVQVQDVDGALREALDSHSLREAVDLVSGATGLPRRQVYQAALKLTR